MTREMTAEVFGALTNHLWQSTLFAIAAGLMALAFRKNRANIRYWLWLSASLKFLLPFSLLISLGSLLAWRSPAPTTTTQAVSFTMEQITQPFPNTVAFAHYAPHTDWLLFSLLSVWALGFAAITLIRFKDWLSIRAAVRSSTPSQIPAPVAVRGSSSLMEPGVVGLDIPGLNALGISRPVLLLPAGIIERLTPPQLNAVLAHEACHVRRRDNLTAALHMIVEAIFWFHPLVWWIGARLVEEREQACDEEVLRLGNDPHVYAESILNVCKFYVESPVTCVSGVTGSDLKKRVGRIMRNHVGETLNSTRKLLLATAAAATFAVPLLAGALIAPRLRAQEPANQEASPTADKPKFDAASIKPTKSGTQGTFFLGGSPGGLYREANSTLRVLIASAYLNGFPPPTQLVLGGPNWIDSEHFDIEARAEGNPGRDQKLRMLQSLLEDRFKLVVHRETRQLPIYALVLSKPGKTGAQLTPHSGDAKCTDAAPGKLLPQPSPGEAMPAYCGGFFMSAKSGDLRETGNGVTVDMLSKQLLQFLDRATVDRTGLTGLFDFTLEFAPQLGPGSQPAPDASASDPSSAPTIFVALQQQLGLKLESTKGPVNVIVVDHVEEPSPN